MNSWLMKPPEIGDMVLVFDRVYSRDVIEPQDRMAILDARMVDWAFRCGPCYGHWVAANCHPDSWGMEFSSKVVHL